jgi:Lamin Tail Domain
MHYFTLGRLGRLFPLGCMLLGLFFTGSAQTPTITCTEINYNSDGSTSSGNWIELHNFGTTAINLGGYRLKEPTAAGFYQFPNNTNLAPGAYWVLSDNVSQFQGAYPGVTNVLGPTGITLGNNGDTLELRNAAGSVVLSIGYDDNAPWPQCADGYGRTLENKNPTANSDLLNPANWINGCMKGSPGTGFSPCVEPIFFNEINYRSPNANDAGDWVELWNKSGTSVNLSAWQFRDSNDTLRYTFPVNTILLPDSFLVIYSSLSKFTAIHGANAAPNKVGPFQFGLSGDGEVIRLFDQNEVLRLSMFYNDAAPWPLLPDGEGPTLELSNPFTDLNTGESWRSSCLFGTPGRKNSACSVGTDVPTVEYPEVRVSPNPCRYECRVTMTFAQSANWQLFDVAGRTVRAGRTDQQAWSLYTADLSPGLYVLKVAGALPVRVVVD